MPKLSKTPDRFFPISELRIESAIVVLSPKISEIKSACFFLSSSPFPKTDSEPLLVPKTPISSIRLFDTPAFASSVFIFPTAFANSFAWIVPSKYSLARDSILLVAPIMPSALFNFSYSSFCRASSFELSLITRLK